MFSFFNKLSKKEQKDLLSIKYTVDGIDIEFNKEVNDPDLVHFYKDFFLELSHDGLSTFDNGIMHIDSENIYPLLLDERASMLMLPTEYNGTVEIKHRGLLNDNAHFEYKLLLDANVLFGYEILGSILKISNKNYQILPRDIYEVFKFIDIAHTSGKMYDRYIVIEHIQGLDGDTISYNGLLDNDLVTTVKGVGVAIEEVEDGSLNIQPLIHGLGHEDVLRNHHTILNHMDDSLLLTKASDGKIIRFALDDKKLSGAKKILQTKKISKGQAKAFKENPEAFLPNFDQEEIDLDLGYRILGYSTELYAGYFGSEKLETPMSQVLNSGAEIELQAMEVLEETVKNMSGKNINSLRERIDIARDKGETEILIDDEKYSIEMISDILSKSQEISSRTEEGSAIEDDTIIKKKYLLKIKANDETSIDETEINLGQDPKIISLTDQKMAIHWQNIQLNPFPHQVLALNWMIDLFNKNFPGALLADDMGLGKTFQIISFINYLYNIKNIDHENHRILIVAPTTLLSAWKNEIENLIIDKNAFRVRIIQGKNKALKKMSDKIKGSIDMGTQSELNDLTNNDADVINLLRNNIYVTTYETMSNYQLVFSQQDIFNFVMNVYDEAQKIKNPNARVTVAAKGISSNIPFTMLVTGTPIENELRDLWSLFDTIDPVFIESWKTFREKYVKTLRNKDMKSVENKLRGKISNYMLRRLKQEHLKGLPDKNFKYIDVTMSSDEVDMHNDILYDGTHHMEKLQKLRLLSLHPSLLKMNKSVPPNLMKEITDEKSFFKSSKMNALVNILDDVKKKKEKILIFVIRYSMQTLLKVALDKKYSLNITIINGKNNTRTYVDEKLITFKSMDGFDIMILSPLAAGVGLTITAANHVVHLERHWNPAKEDQASDRVYRIGQTKDVNIFHLIHQSNKAIPTFDQGLHKLIESKRSLSNGTLIPTPSVKDSEILESFFGPSSYEEYLQNLSPKEFEEEMLGLFQKAGYECSITPKYPTESGTDILARKAEKTIAIQCKHTSKNKKQGRDAIKQLVAEAMPVYPKAIYVALTNYYFNDNARKLARHHNIKLIEKDKLLKFVDDSNLINVLIGEKTRL